MSKTSNHQDPSPARVGLVARIAHQMIARDIPALPRNFELVHAAVAGDNPALARALAGLGDAPSQSAMDALGLAHGLAGHAALAIGQRAADAQKIIDQIVRGSDAERRGKAATLQELDETVERLSRHAGDPEDLASEAGRLAAMARRLADREAAYAQRLDDLLARMKVLRAGLAADHATLTHDPATGLANQSALSTRLKAFYEAEDDRPAALFVAMRIDNLAGLVATHVAGGAEEALARLATILRKAVKKDDFLARTAADRFAVLLVDVERDHAASIIARIGERIAAEPFLFGGRAFPPGTLTLTAGFATTDAAGGAAMVQRQAERALHAAIEAGAALRAYSADVSARMAPAYGRDVA